MTVRTPRRRAALLFARTFALTLPLTLALPVPALASAQTWWFSSGDPDRKIRVEAPVKARMVVGHLGRGYLGVRLLGVTPELQDFYGASGAAGVLVSAVEEESPAAAAGVRVGDLIVSVGDEETARPEQVVRAVGRLEPEEMVSLGLVRDRAPLTLQVTVGEREGAVWLSGDDLPDWEGLDRLREELPRVVLDSEDAREAMREAFEEARAQLSAVDFGEMAERLAEAEERLRELERKLADRNPEE